MLVYIARRACLMRQAIYSSFLLISIGGVCFECLSSSYQIFVRISNSDIMNSCQYVLFRIVLFFLFSFGGMSHAVLESALAVPRKSDQ